MSIEVKDLLKAYAAVFSTPDGQAVLSDLVIFAGQYSAMSNVPEDHVVRAGRMDVIVRIIRMRQRADESKPRRLRGRTAIPPADPDVD
jgi:hypothetical protein